MRNKYLIKTDNRPTEAFSSTEEAWLWYCLCQKLGRESPKGNESRIARPCETVDIEIALNRLKQERKITAAHQLVLKHFGFLQMPPHPNFNATNRLKRLWEEALGFLDVVLRKKRNSVLFLKGNYNENHKDIRL